MGQTMSAFDRRTMMNEPSMMVTYVCCIESATLFNFCCRCLCDFLVINDRGKLLLLLLPSDDWLSPSSWRTLCDLFAHPSCTFSTIVSKVSEKWNGTRVALRCCSATSSRIAHPRVWRAVAWPCLCPALGFPCRASAERKVSEPPLGCSRSLCAGGRRIRSI